MSSQRSDWRERLSVNPSRMEQELAIKLQDDRISYLTQVEIPVTTADLYFPLEPRPLLVFIDGRVHLGTTQMAKDEELRSLLGREDTEYSNCLTTATQTRKETNYTSKFSMIYGRRKLLLWNITTKPNAILVIAKDKP